MKPSQSSPGPLTGRGGLAEVDADFTEVSTQTGAQAPHCGGRHLSFLVSVKDRRGVYLPGVYTARVLHWIPEFVLTGNDSLPQSACKSSPL